MANRDIHDLKKDLVRLAKKRANYYRYYKGERDRDIFNYTGLFKENGRVVTAEEFTNKFGNKIEYGLAMLEKLLDRNYIRDVNERYKENVIAMLVGMGFEEQAMQVGAMSLREFMKEFNKGTWDNLKETYNDYETIRISEHFDKSLGLDAYEGIPERVLGLGVFKEG